MSQNENEVSDAAVFRQCWRRLTPDAQRMLSGMPKDKLSVLELWFEDDGTLTGSEASTGECLGHLLMACGYNALDALREATLFTQKLCKERA